MATTKAEQQIGHRVRRDDISSLNERQMLRRRVGSCLSDSDRRAGIFTTSSSARFGYVNDGRHRSLTRDSSGIVPVPREAHEA